MINKQTDGKKSLKCSRGTVETYMRKGMKADSQLQVSFIDSHQTTFAAQQQAAFDDVANREQKPCICPLTRQADRITKYAWLSLARYQASALSLGAEQTHGQPNMSALTGSRRLSFTHLTTQSPNYVKRRHNISMINKNNKDEGTRNRCLQSLSFGYL